MLFIVTLYFIPLIAIILAILTKRKINWISIVLLIGLPSIIIFKTKDYSIQKQVEDTEYWSHLIVRAEYFEDWSTYVERTCTRSYSCNCTRDSKGNKSCSTCYEDYDCSYCDDTPTKCFGYDQYGKQHEITYALYKELERRWGNPKFIELNRKINKHFSCGKDGDEYEITWNGDINTAFTLTTIHTYVNKVQASTSSVGYPKLSDAELKSLNGKVYGYPDVDGNGYCKHLIGANDPQTEQYLQWWGGKFGREKQIIFNVFVYYGANISYEQKRFWNGGNKNEYTVLLGKTSDGTIGWVDVITWTEQSGLINDTKQYVLANPSASLYDITTTISKQLEEQWVRRPFATFNYLRIEPTRTAWTTALIINLVLCTLIVLLSDFKIRNNI